jgi:RHS repeat-associated protein
MTASLAGIKRNRIVAAIAVAVVVLSAIAIGVIVAMRTSTNASAFGALDACDPAGLVPCEQQAAYVSLPIADTGLMLTYSSQWAAGRQDRPDWGAQSLGLGDWSIDAVQRYDTIHHVLIGGDGSWRFANEVALPTGETAVPSYDGAVAYVFDRAGRHVRTVDGHLGTVFLIITYDSAGRLTTLDGTANGQAAHLRVQRSANGTPVVLFGTDGASTSLEVDGSGRLVAIRDPAGDLTQFAWAAGGLVRSQTDALGTVTRFTYDAAGRLGSTTDADGVTQRLARIDISGGFEVRVSTPQGRVTTYRSESVGGGVRRTFIGPDGATTTETTAADGSRAITLPDGTARSIGAVPSPIWGSTAPVLTPDVETRPDKVVSQTEVNQDLKENGGMPYMLSGSITTSINGQAWVETFDPAGRTVTQSDPLGRKTVQTYDAVGRLVAQSSPGSAPVTYTYDAQGREATDTVGRGGLAQTTRYAYDAATGTITITDPLGRTETTVVDGAGRTLTTSGPDGSTIVTAYDAAGRLTQVQPPGGSSFTLGNSPAGRLTAFLPPAVGTDAAIETARYDSDGNLVAAAGLGSQAMTFTYDRAGRPIGLTFDQGQTTASYASGSGLLAGTAAPGGVVTAYSYAGSLLDNLTWSGPLSGSVIDSLDAYGRIAAEAVDGSAMPMSYDGSGDLTGVGGLTLVRDPASGLVTHTTLGSVQTDLEYDASAQLIHTTATAAGKVVLDLRFGRDALGRIASAAETGPNGSTTTSTYAYDSANRLTRIQVDGRVVETETYDAAGNRTAVAYPAGVTAASYDAQDRLVSWGNAEYSWTPAGYLTRRLAPSGETSFSFDELGRLLGVTLSDGRAVSYLVDADGRRIGREIGGKLVAGYLYDLAGNVMAETDGTGAVTARFAYDDLGHLALIERGGNSYRVVTDTVGSPLLVIDSHSGAVMDAISYDSWGRITSETAPGTIPFGFTGGLLDPDTGLVHLGARDYDPTTGRWTAPDPILFAGGDANLYRYVGDDPINRVDPSGLTPNSSPPSPQQPWSCFGLGCKHFPSGAQAPDYACAFGRCSVGPNGFSCRAISCSGPDVDCLFCSYGDTHLLTGDGVHFDFQAAGEFIASMSPESKIEIQVRQEPWTGRTDVTFGTAVAVNVTGDRVGVYAREPSFLMVNGTAVNAPDMTERLPHGGTLVHHGALVKIMWPDGSRLTVTLVGTTLNYNYRPAPGVGAQLHGLLGSADGNPGNDLTGRDGVVLEPSDPAYNKKLYQQFGNSWRISQAESLFDYQPGESTATFTRLDIPSADETAGSLPSAARANAEAICRAVGVQNQPTLDDCILDVGLTGDPAFAAGSAAVAATGVAPNTNPGTGSVSTLKLGQTVSGSISSLTHHDDYTFTAAGGEIVYLQAKGTCVNSLAWSLLQPDGSTKDSNPTCDDIGREVLTTAGVWTVRVNSSDAATGTYAFTVLAVPAPTANALTVGQEVSASIDQVGRWNDYTFTATPGEIVYLQASGTCVGRLSWSLLRPDGTTKDFNPTCDDIGREVLTTAGVWRVRVGAPDVTTGAYAFTMLAVPAPITSALTLGQAVSGSVDQIGQWIDYTFTATPGEIVYLQSSGTCGVGLNWALLRPDGSTQDWNPTCRDIGREVLTTVGVWTVRVSSDGTAIGPYAFTVRAST